MDTAK